MARIRTVKPDFFTSDDICALSPLARLLYIGLWCEADREGRMVWAPRTFKRRYLPEDDCEIEEVCEELREAGLVVLYGDTLARIPTFSKHQHVNPREAASTLAPPSDDASVTRQARDSDAQAGREGKEGEGKEIQSNDCTPAEGGKAKRKSRLPEDFEATPERLEYAKAQGCTDPADTFARFKLHHQSKGTLALDWEKGWQYWCRNESNFRRPQAGKFDRTEGLPTSRDGDGQWAARVRGWTPGRFWNRGDWGPPPNEPGCRAPSHLITQWRPETLQ
jgi:hypothetical protein